MRIELYRTISKQVAKTNGQYPLSEQRTSLLHEPIERGCRAGLSHVNPPSHCRQVYPDTHVGQACISWRMTSNT